ncbi:hypothetical protein NP493_211g03001 [Ridgeia piscesae]|uniref:Uncharacterized protein n=1 Tax=Ridgeia piscesae TaxID=27915 RepID=A0AAD9P1A3_RIDPI|nr:hypothetical protein NP493_211g03001 [Ridgeia piscesae]
MHAPCCHGWATDKQQQQQQSPAQQQQRQGDAATACASGQSLSGRMPQTGVKSSGVGKQHKHAAGGAANWMARHTNAADFDSRHQGAQMSTLKATCPVHKGHAAKRCGAATEAANCRRFRGATPGKRAGKAAGRPPGHGGKKTPAGSQRSNRNGAVQKRWNGQPTLEIRKARQRRASGVSMMNLSNNANSGRIPPAALVQPANAAGLLGSGWCVIL